MKMFLYNNIVTELHIHLNIQRYNLKSNQVKSKIA